MDKGQGVDESPQLQAMRTYSEEMNKRAKSKVPFTDNELLSLNKSMANLRTTTDVKALREFWSRVGHVPHTKDWMETLENTSKLKALLNINSEDMLANSWLGRVLHEGHWKDAVCQKRPFVVLVTGLNGIRKTTALYQPWFSKLLSEALETTEELPTGHNSFFRQLDHMIATICNDEFENLYRSTKMLKSEGVPPATVVKAYSEQKAAIFARYRTVSELLGIILMETAQKQMKNCLLETTGRNRGMFEFVDRMFHGKGYTKLALHFVINDVKAAQKSVIRRMESEIEVGSCATTPEEVVLVNQGGPYGSEVLPAVKAESDKVWEAVEQGEFCTDWLKASIRIEAYDEEPWKACAVRPDGSLGTYYKFERPTVPNITS